MHKTSKSAAVSVVVVAAVLLVVSAILAPNLIGSDDLAQVCFGSECISVEIAETREERVQGLMFRQELGEREGMLFVFPTEGVYTFWMKNTFIPLTVIWVNNEFEVVDVQDAVPCTTNACKRYTPKASARYVVEVNSEFVRDLIRVGDKVKIEGV